MKNSSESRRAEVLLLTSMRARECGGGSVQTSPAITCRPRQRTPSGRWRAGGRSPGAGDLPASFLGSIRRSAGARRDCRNQVIAAPAAQGAFSDLLVIR